MQDNPEFKGVEPIKAQVETWESVSPSKMKVERLAGLSNEVWKVTATDPDVTPHAVVYRKFGTGAAICDRDRENYILKGLSKRKIAPKYFGGDSQYRVEKFQESKLMEPEELNNKHHRRSLAKLVAELHQMKFEKMEKKPAFLKIIEGNKYLETFKEKAARDVYTPVESKFVKNALTLADEKEINFLKSIAPKNEGSVVFSHNDLHSQNVLILAKDESLQLIDYEYSDYNYRGYDISNLFNETMFVYDTAEHPHYTVDESKYPDDHSLKDFIKYYLFFSKFGEEKYQLEDILKKDSFRDEYVKENHDGEAFDKEVEEIFEEVQVCQLYSHYFWILWGVIMSHENDMEFDYVHYAEKRFEIYTKLKKRFCQENNDELKQDAQDKSEDTTAP